MSDDVLPPADGPAFTCRDCDSDVYQFGRSWCPVPPLCATCQWIVDYVPEAERAEARARYVR